MVQVRCRKNVGEKVQATTDRDQLLSLGFRETACHFCGEGGGEVIADALPDAYDAELD